MAKTNSSPIWIRRLSKGDLHDLIAKVKNRDLPSIERAIDFVTADSLGMWHNRARAKLCRYFKNEPPNNEQQRRLVETIEQRLVTGSFYEQFKDQLGMAAIFDPAQIKQAAEIAIEDEKQYIRRYAKWVLNRIKSQDKP